MAPQKTRPTAIPAALLPVLLTAAGLGVGLAAGFAAGAGTRSDPEAAAPDIAAAVSDQDPDADGPSAALAAQARALKFIPPHEPVPHCADFTGTGTIPPGDTLLIFDDDTAGYDYDGRAASSGPDRWEAGDRWIGPDGTADASGSVHMSAVLVPTGAADFLDEVPNVYRTAWPKAVLRLGAVADTMLVRRGPDDRPCPH